ncbi:MAG TPA: PSD1 and planctomycete cytochrome C domain-containing protein [Fimbriimonadaceae bacterium]|nr:PSD1 and planctomycete cytochrome C domain-containing protein [Fimbriimonadaceae bacterium]
MTSPRFRLLRWVPPLAAAVCFTIGAISSTATRGQGQWADKPTEEQRTFFEAKIRPILLDNCVSCHGPKMQMAGLRLDQLAGLRKGSDSGPVVKPGDAGGSKLIQAIRHEGGLKMPPGKKLNAEQIALLEGWVQMGAPWPEAGPQSDQSKPLWSLQPVTKPTAPKVRGGAWLRNPIDAFVLASLEAKGLQPAEQADRRTLIRRVTYSLTGLPPSAGEVDAFLADTGTDAYNKVVDRLLASPRYGERWARLWLDVARYADTKGYVFEEDRNFHHAYTYRDWVINAFNRDLPYDRFVMEQIAADQLPDVRDSADRAALAAMGFLTLGRRFLNNEHDIIDDRIDVTMRGFQGLTVACARCHDHKFDPIPTQDYYSLYGVFASSQEATVPISPPAIRDPWLAHSRQVGEAERVVRSLVMEQVKRLRKMVAEPNGQTVAPEVRQTLQMLREDAVPEGDVLKKLLPAFEATANERLTDLRRNLEEIKKAAPPAPEFAITLQDRQNPRDSVVFRRGNPGNRGEPAPRRYLAALAKPGAPREQWSAGSGRLQLAQAIASGQNPLTARVFVNRVWQHHFGAGLARTPSDFGHQGEAPSHPELLDYLASTFMENGWSIKKLHRLIVTSATYRQASSPRQPLALQIDADNRLLSRVSRRRLDLEQMRDSIVLAAGALDLGQTGGQSVDLWSRPFAKRRAVYGFVERQNLPGVFRTFDFASPDSTSPGRFMTTVPQQALFFMNSPFVVEHARLLAARPEIAQAASDQQRVQRLYRLIYARLPDPEELAAGLEFLAKGKAEERRTLYAQALLMSNEFVFID